MVVSASQFANGSELYPINNYFKSYPLTWDSDLQSYEIDAIYSAGTVYIPHCVICSLNLSNEFKNNVEVKPNCVHKIYCTFDLLERRYKKNICKTCNIKWYNVDISYCTECNGYLVNECSNHNVCNCVFSDRIKRAQKVKGKKCIIFDDNKMEIYENDDIIDYVKARKINADDEQVIGVESELKPLNSNEKVNVNNVSLENSIKNINENKNKRKRKWWDCLRFF